MHGGKRTGAGRKKGSLSRRTQEIISAAAAEGISPLEVLVQSMRSAWQDGDKDKACQWAEKAAPYMHPRLAAVEHSGNEDKPLSFNITSGVPREMDDAEHTNGHAGPSH